MVKISVIFCILYLFFVVNKVNCLKGQNVQEKPNIVVIMADDLGSFDLSLRGCNEILTPNIDALGYQGVIFNRHYTQALCTPSRAAFLTGKYPIHTGLQNLVILEDEPRGLPLTEKLLPQYLKEVGYKTHMVGKWHLGIAKKTFIPTKRGFDSYVGYLGPYIDYFDYTLYNPLRNLARGFDFRRNESIYRDTVGQYVTDVFSDEASKTIRNHDPSQGPMFLYIAHLAPHAANQDDPLQAIPEDLATVTHIKDPKRRYFAAMVKALDRSVGFVVEALQEKDMLKNTIILFFSDNGGATLGPLSVAASNYPLRGQKDGPWEGSVRNPALIWSPLLQKRHYVSKHVIHITDWLPTFVQAAGTISYKFQKLDGKDIWPTLSHNKSPLRREILHNIDTIEGYSSYFRDGWKYINGTSRGGRYDGWLGNTTGIRCPENPFYPELVMKSAVWKALNPFALKSLNAKNIENIRDKTKIVCQKKISPARECNPLRAPCLFYVDADPCEINNLAHFRPIRMQVMEKRLRSFQQTSLPPSNVAPDPAANPALHGNIWTWWLGEE